MTNDTRRRGLFRLNFNLPERIEAALFRPRLDNLTVEPCVYSEALAAIGVFGATAEDATRYVTETARQSNLRLVTDLVVECECQENNTQGACDGCGRQGKEYPEAWIA